MRCSDALPDEISPTRPNIHCSQLESCGLLGIPDAAHDRRHPNLDLGEGEGGVFCSDDEVARRSGREPCAQSARVCRSGRLGRLGTGRQLPSSVADIRSATRNRLRAQGRRQPSASRQVKSAVLSVCSPIDTTRLRLGAYRSLCRGPGRRRLWA